MERVFYQEGSLMERVVYHEGVFNGEGRLS